MKLSSIVKLKYQTVIKWRKKIASENTVLHFLSNTVENMYSLFWHINQGDDVARYAIDATNRVHFEIPIPSLPSPHHSAPPFSFISVIDTKS